MIHVNSFMNRYVMGLKKFL